MRDYPPKGSWVTFKGLRTEDLNGQLAQVMSDITGNNKVVVAVHNKLAFEERDHSDAFKNSAVSRLLGPGATSKCIRKYMVAGPGGLKLCKLEKIELLPPDQLTTCVRVACRGEKQEGGLAWEEVSFPKSHPIFQQPSNCPIAEKIGCPLILTKLEIPAAKEKQLKQLGIERDWCINQPCVYLKSAVDTGLAAQDFDLSNVDYVGPCYVCRPGGEVSWTLQDQIVMQNYFSHLMNECYGSEPKDFSPARDLSAMHFARHAKPDAAVVCHEERSVEVHELLQSAFLGDFDKIYELLNSAEITKEDVNEKNTTGMTLLDAAVYGGRGEVVAAVLSHSKFDIDRLEPDMAENLRHYWSVAQRNEQLPADQAQWVATLPLSFVKNKRSGGNAGVDGMKAALSEEMFIPEKAHEFSPLKTLEDLEVDMLLLERYPFPREKVGDLLENSDYKNFVNRICPPGQPLLAVAAVNMDLLERLYSVVLALSMMKRCYEWPEHPKDPECAWEFSEYWRVLRSEIRKIGWILFFRGSKQSMNVYEWALGRVVEMVIDQTVRTPGWEDAWLTMHVDGDWDEVGHYVR
jgi:hypothetical protein